MIVELASYDANKVTQFTEVARNIAAWNRNRRGVRHIAAITNNLEQARELGAGVKPRHAENWGMCYYRRSWAVTEARYLEEAVIWINPTIRAKGETTKTIAHEVAHALTQGAHGYTWRRMNALLLPFAETLLDGFITSALYDDIRRTVGRYGVRYEHTSETWYDANDKKDEEASKHYEAQNRTWQKFKYMVEG